MWDLTFLLSALQNLSSRQMFGQDFFKCSQPPRRENKHFLMMRDRSVRSCAFSECSPHHVRVSISFSIFVRKWSPGGERSMVVFGVLSYLGLKACLSLSILRWCPKKVRRVATYRKLRKVSSRVPKKKKEKAKRRKKKERNEAKEEKACPVREKRWSSWKCKVSCECNGAPMLRFRSLRGWCSRQASDRDRPCATPHKSEPC